MPTRRQRPIYQMPLPLYGLNDKDSAYAIHPKSAVDIKNLEIGEDVVFSRLGYTQYGDNPGSGPIQNMYDYKKSDGTVKILRARQAIIEEYNTGANTWDSLALPIAITANQKVAFATLNDLCIIESTKENDLKYNGTNVTEIVGNPLADVMEIFQNRLLKFRFSNSTLYWSDINDPETFDAAAFLRIDPNNASLGKGIKELNGQVIIFKGNKKYILTQLVGGVVYPIDGSISTVSHYSIVSTGSTLIFLSTSGWYELSGTRTRFISDNVNMSKLDSSRLHTAHAVYHENRYRCFVNSSGSNYNDREYVFYLNMHTPFEENPYPITRNEGLNGLCYLETDRSGERILYFGDSRPDSGSPAVGYALTYRMNDGLNDNGSTIDAEWISKLIANQTPFFAKKYKKIYTRIISQTGLIVYVAYRFSTIDAWSEIALSIERTELSWILDDGSEIEEWDEGYGWPFEGSEDQFIAVTNAGRPRTIQFRNRISEDDAQARWIYQAYRYRIRDKFK